MQRLTVTVDDELVSEIDHFMKSRGYQNRSETFRDLARAGLQQVHEEGAESSDCVAALVFGYEYETRELAKRLAALRHDHHDLIVSTMRIELDHHNCLELALLRGKTADVRHFASHVIAERGVRHGKLVLVPVELSVEAHKHGRRSARHLHARVREAGS